MLASRGLSFFFFYFPSAFLTVDKKRVPVSDEGAMIPPVDYLPGPHVYFSSRFPYRRKKEIVPSSLRPHGLQSVEFSRPGYWSGSPFPSPGDLPNPGIEPRSLTLQADSLPAEPQGRQK